MNKALKILIITASVITVLCLCVAMYLLLDDGRLIQVELDGTENQSVRFERLGLVPGESCEYTLRFTGKADRYALKLVFSETEASQTLKNYVCVRISADGETLCDSLLSDVLCGDGIELFADFTSKAKKDVKVVYCIPSDVGNDAQNAVADFELLITASEE